MNFKWEANEVAFDILEFSLYCYERSLRNLLAKGPNWELPNKGCRLVNQ